MIIRELTLHNFGVYASTNKFEFRGKKPVVLVGGMNGRGKTTFLEAVLLSLYGANSFAYTESKYKSFGQYLKSFVNISDGTLETFVDLEFSMEREIYKIHREWSGAKRRVAERIKVYKDGKFNQFLTDNWTMFIENVLPSGLANFFFFDGEKIAELAVEDTSTQMKESIRMLLGISILDVLKNDLGRIINRTEKSQIGNLEKQEVERLRERKNQAVNALELLDAEITLLEEQKMELARILEQKQQEYSTKGGDIIIQKQELFRERAAVDSRINTLKEHLIVDAASELPFVLVQDLLRKIRESAEIEQDQRMLAAALKKMRSMLPEYTKENASDKDTAIRFISFIDGKVESAEKVTSRNLSDTSLFKLQVLLDDQLLATKFNTLAHQEAFVGLQAEAEQLDTYLAVDIDEKAIAEIYRQIKEIEKKIIDLDVQLESKREKRKTCNGEMINAVSIFNRSVETYLKRIELNDDADRIVKYSHMATVILEKYKIRLQKNKINVVAETMTACYKKLANKKYLIERIEMDPISLDLKYLNANGEEIVKDSLSAGEKQLMVISLLWALALCSKKKLPVIIDTPLSRLDSAHRLSIIQTYFPQASEQTIILSTDAEIDQNYYEMMRENIGDEFTLIYDDVTKSTTIRRGYFGEGSKCL